MTGDIVRRAVGFMKMGRPKPVWFETVASKYPPLTFAAPKAVKASRAGPNPKNGPEAIWRPPKLHFPEDKYMKKLHKSHPMERLRPTTLNEVEQDPKDVNAIIRSQLELMETGLSPEAAFTQASERFWAARKAEEIKDRIAREQEKFNQDQAGACAGQRAPMRRTEPIGDAIRKMLLEEKRVLIEARQAALKSPY